MYIYVYIHGHMAIRMYVYIYICTMATAQAVQKGVSDFDHIPGSPCSLLFLAVPSLSLSPLVPFCTVGLPLACSDCFGRPWPCTALLALVTVRVLRALLRPTLSVVDMERGRARERESRPVERTNQKANPQGVESSTTQLPPVSNHHCVLEQKPAPRVDSSDTDIHKQAPEAKKIKLEPKDSNTQEDSPMEPPKPSDEPPQNSKAPEAHEVFDLTQDDDDELKACAEAHQGVGTFTSDMGRGVPQQAPNSGVFASLPRGAGQDAPEWLKGLTESLNGLHLKSDRTHEYCVQLGSSVAQHDTRIAHLEAAAKEQLDNHEAALDRITALEKAVVELDRKSRSITPPRAPDTPRGSRLGNVSPRSPRSNPGAFPGESLRDPEQDLCLVVGGWSDARVAEAEEELRNLFEAAGMSGHLGSLSGPAGRTNFLRVTLNFQGIQDLGRKRQLQTKVLDKLKHLKGKSGIEGQDNCNLWVTKDRSIEERIRIRALVLTKNFYEKLPQPPEPEPRRPPP